MNLFHFLSTLISPSTSPSCPGWATTTWLLSDIPNHTSSSPPWISRHATRWGKPIFAKKGMSSLPIWPRPASAPYTLPTLETFKPGASSPSAGHKKRSYIWTAICMWCFPSGKSAPTPSVQKWSLFWLCRFPQARLSRSIPAVTSGPWISSSQLMTVRRLRSTPNGWIGPGHWGSFSNNRKMRWSPQLLTSFVPRSRGSSKPRSWSTSWRQWPRMPRRTPSVTGPLPLVGQWLEELSSAYFSFSAAGECVATQDQPRQHTQHPQHLQLHPPSSTWRSIPSEDEDLEDLYFLLCIVSWKILSSLFSCLSNPPNNGRDIW